MIITAENCKLRFEINSKDILSQFLANIVLLSRGLARTLEQTIESSGPSIELLSGGLAVGQLKPLEEEDDLFASGAYTVLRTTSLDVLGWFGTFTNSEVDGPVTLQIGDDTLEINSPLAQPTFSVTTEEDRISMGTGALSGLDYRIMDIFQAGTAIEDGSPREFTVATSLNPDADYFASHLLLEDAYGKACWKSIL